MREKVQSRQYFKALKSLQKGLHKQKTIIQYARAKASRKRTKKAHETRINRLKKDLTEEKS